MQQDPPVALACRSLTRTYTSRFRRNRFTAVDGVDLHVPAGSAFALVGPNGAGKTTLMLMAIGLMRPTSGEARIEGRDARTAAARRHVGFVPEKFQLPAQLTAREFLRMHGTLAGLSRSDTVARTRDVVELVDLEDRIDDRLHAFSKGMQQRVAIAQALIARPRLLVLDEPTSALDPLQRRALRDTLHRVHGDGVTVVLNSHNLAEVEDICDHLAILEAGRIVASGALRDMVERTTRVRVRLRGWNDQLAASLSTRVHLDALHHDEDQTHFTASIPNEDAVAWIAHEVVTSGAWLLELTPSGEGLEDLFVRTIAGAAATGVEAPAVAPSSRPAAPHAEGER